MTLRRLSALVIVLVVLAALGLQFALNGRNPALADWGLRAWDLGRYFTILTCGLVGVLMAQEAAGRPVGANWLATAVLSIVMVGVIFQVLLAPPEALTGIDWWPDFAFHAAIPVLTAAWWGVWGQKGLSLRALPMWLGWPVAYCAYALVRGAIEGAYPYFFLDVGRFGAGAVALNIVGLVAVFSATGGVIWALSRVLPKRAG